MSCLIDTEAPTKWKKLTTWWPACSHDTMQRTDLKEMRGEKKKKKTDPKTKD